MARVVVILDVGRGQEALTFVSQYTAETWLAAHPEVDDSVQGIVPIADRRSVAVYARRTGADS